MKLPELPPRGYQNADGWCDDAMRAYGIACAQAALAAAAKVCNGHEACQSGDEWLTGYAVAVKDIAAAIQATQVES